MLNKKFKLNPIDINNIQIYGEVNGWAWRRRVSYAGLSYGFQIKFFNTKGHLIKISNSDEDGTVGNEKTLLKRIQKILEKEE